MHKSLIAGALALAILSPAAGAFAQDAASFPKTAEEIKPAAIKDPQGFTNKALASGDFEIQSSQLALGKTQNADIKSFAQQMIDDHTKAAAELKTAAAAQGGVMLPTAVDADVAGKMQQLQNAAAADFDKLYVDLQTAGHVEAVALFAGYAQDGASGALKDFASKTLPTLKMHYQHVLTLPH